MVQRLSDFIVDRQVRNSLLSEKDRVVYQYAYVVLLGQAMNIIAAVLIGLLFDSLVLVTVFLAAYIPLRSFAGGYHAGTSERCTVVSAVMLCILSLVVRAVDSKSLLYVGMAGEVVSGLAVWLLAPVEAGNKPLDELEVVRFRAKARGIWCLEVVISMVCCLVGFIQAGAVIMMSHLVLAMMLGLGSQRRIKNKSKGDKAYVKI